VLSATYLLKAAKDLVDGLTEQAPIKVIVFWLFASACLARLDSTAFSYLNNRFHAAGCASK
jgi:hypothetical protein